MRRAVFIAVFVLSFVVIGAYVALHGIGGGGADRTFNVTVTGDKMIPDTLTVKQNDNVTITVNVDKAEEIHLHGYDIHFDAAPGKPATHSFKADKTGNFDIEIEDTSTGVGSLVVQQ